MTTYELNRTLQKLCIEMWNKCFEEKLKLANLYILSEFEVFKVIEGNNQYSPLMESVSEVKNIILKQNTKIITTEITDSINDSVADYFSYFQNTLTVHCKFEEAYQLLLK